MAVGVDEGERRRRKVVPQKDEVCFLAGFDAADGVIQAEGGGTAAGCPVNDVFGAQGRVSDGVAGLVGTQVLVGAVGALFLCGAAPTEPEPGSAGDKAGTPDRAPDTAYPRRDGLCAGQ
jgi:hypothetical protein